MQIGDKIKLKRVERKLTQEELAQKAKLSSWTITAIESNRANPKIKTLEAIAEVLECDLKVWLEDKVFWNGLFFESVHTEIDGVVVKSLYNPELVNNNYSPILSIIGYKTHYIDWNPETRRLIIKTKDLTPSPSLHQQVGDKRGEGNKA